jgi:ankyrin repeat protein
LAESIVGYERQQGPYSFALCVSRIFDAEDSYVSEIVFILLKAGAALVISQDDQQGGIHERPFCDSKDRFGKTPLAIASERGLENAAKILLDTGQVDINAGNLEGVTPLMRASYRGHTSMVRFLPEQDGLHIDAVDKVAGVH